ncbi:MAG: type VI secretion system baseplate subunit TssK [Planctomycetaceae bacterium]|jgi:type VI secretion system protein ImpJ|nr:type VI secretion system baseplate subunit TssK [Planctomycetaceae bacterium]
MKNLPVHWYEGLFLRPQHLQASDRYWSELLSTSLRSDNPYNYGILSFEYSKEALANQQFEVRTLKARMRDGTIIELELGQEPDRLDLKKAMDGESDHLGVELGDAFDGESAIRVYLALPKLQLGRTNCGTAGDSGGMRYSEARITVPDENRGGYDQEVQFREMNMKLLLSTQDVSGHELLPIAQVKRASQAEPTPELDEEYIPPVVSIDAWPGLAGDIVQALLDVIGQNIEVLSQQVITRGTSRDSQVPGDQDRISLLEKLNEAYATLSIMGFARGIHPLVVYCELCRILGQVSIFTPARRTVDIPPYDHEDLGRIFREVKERIIAAIRSLPTVSYERRFFLGAGLGMQVTLEPTWFHSSWEWVIGVRKGGDLTMKECRELLTGQLDWKLGSSRQVENLFLRRQDGLHLEPVDRPLHALPAKQDWIYYEVVRDDSPGSAWHDVVQTQTLAMRLKDSLILNKDRLQGEQEMVVAARGRKVELQFALFAIPQRQ